MKFVPRYGTITFGLPPNIHSSIANTMNDSISHSLRWNGPIAFSSAAAQSEISGLFLISGG